MDWLEAYQKGFSEFGNISKVISYEINLDFFIPEIIFVLLLGGFAYILFCVVLKISEKRRDK